MAAVCGLGLALAANAQIAVSSLTAAGGHVVNGMLAVTSGQPYVFTVRAASGNLSTCRTVWVALEGLIPLQPKQAGIISESDALLSFRAMVKEGEEGVYDLYLCQDVPPTRSTVYQAKYRVTAPVTAAPNIDVEDEIHKTRQEIRQALNRVAALEKQMGLLKGLGGRTESVETGLKQARADLGSKATKQEVAEVAEQVKAVAAKSDGLANNIQAMQASVAEVRNDYQVLVNRIQSNEAAIAGNEGAVGRVQGRVDAVSGAVVHLADTLSHRKVTGNILWFIPKRMLGLRQAELVRVEANRQAPDKPAAPANAQPAVEPSARQ